MGSHACSRQPLCRQLRGAHGERSSTLPYFLFSNAKGELSTSRDISYHRMITYVPDRRDTAFRACFSCKHRLASTVHLCLSDDQARSKECTHWLHPAARHSQLATTIFIRAEHRK